MSVTFSSEEICGIILDNQELSVENQEYFSVDKETIDNIFAKINSCNSVLNMKRRIIKRAAYILSLITNLQPFYEFNRHTAFSTAMDFLRRNNLNLPMDTLSKEKEVFDLLDKTKNKKKDDPTVLGEVENYLTANVVDYYYFR